MSADTIVRCRCGHMKAQHQETRWFESSPEGSGVYNTCMVPHCDCQRFKRESPPVEKGMLDSLDLENEPPSFSELK